jgi:N-Dimethylarginine dimethylaminohydrolase
MQKDTLKNYGAEGIGQLKKVMLHCPEESIYRIGDNNYKFYLFDRVPDYEKYIQEHKSYQKLLQSVGVDTYELSDFIVNNRELMGYLPNLAYLNDIAAVTGKGSIISTMCPGGRQYEEIAVKEALTSLGIPVLHACEPGEQFEGLIVLSPDALFIADTERHSKESIERFINVALQHFKEIIYVEIPQARRFMHPDMIFNKTSEHLGLVYLPAFLHCWHIQKDTRHEIDFMSYVKSKKMELVNISDEEQQKWGTSFVTLSPNHVINYDISLKPGTIKNLESLGVRFTHFHPDAMLAGGGSLRCLTLRLLRE